MGRIHQYFIAPGNTEEPLPIPESPWHAGHVAKLPLEHFSVILDFAQSYDAARAEELQKFALPVGGSVSASRQALEDMQRFLAELKERILQSPPLTPEATEEIPEDYANDEHGRMLDAIAAVLEVAKQTGQPFTAGSE